MSTPESLYRLVERWRKDAERQWSEGDNGQSVQSEASANELESALRAWEAQILTGIEARKTEQNVFGPLHTMAINQSAQGILENILGLPSKEQKVLDKA